jgi:hypothetical protein
LWGTVHEKEFLKAARIHCFRFFPSKFLKFEKTQKSEEAETPDNGAGHA